MKNITVDSVIALLKKQGNAKTKKSQENFGIKNIVSYGLTQPQIKTIAKSIGKNQELALQLWKTGILEARHVAIQIADKKLLNDEWIESWHADLSSWDVVDDFCATLLCTYENAFAKVKQWSKCEGEFQKRTAFSLIAYLAVHDKAAPNKKFLQLFSIIKKGASDERNFVKKAVNWSIRQMGKRNIQLCNACIVLAEEIQKKNSASARWIAADALRELRKYKAEGKIKNVGVN